MAPYTGYIYDFIQKCMSVQFPFITFNKTSPCYTCHFSKHKILPYPVSTTSSSTMLELVHPYILGPYSTIPLMDTNTS